MPNSYTRNLKTQQIFWQIQSKQKETGKWVLGLVVPASHITILSLLPYPTLPLPLPLPTAEEKRLQIYLFIYLFVCF